MLICFKCVKFYKKAKGFRKPTYKFNTIKIWFPKQFKRYFNGFISAHVVNRFMNENSEPLPIVLDYYLSTSQQYLLDNWGYIYCGWENMGLFSHWNQSLFLCC